MSNEVLVLDRVRARGVEWSRAEQQRYLFGLCVRIATAGMARYGEAYQVSSIAYVPAADLSWVDSEIAEYLCTFSN